MPPAFDPRALRWLRVAAIVAAAASIGVAHRTGLLAKFADPSGVARTLVELGPWGWLAFVVAFAVLQPFGIPGTLFVVAAPLIWPWPTAFALSMTGTMAASVVGFSFSRLVARDFVASLVPPRFRRWDSALEERAFATVLVLRFVFWMPPLLHAFFGISRVSFATHFWASFVGYLVPLFLLSYFGQALVDAARHAPPWVWAAVVASFATIVATSWLVRRRRRAASNDSPS